MKESKRLFVAILIMNSLLGSAGQLLFKLGVQSASLYPMLAYIFAGMVIYLASTVTYFFVLSRTHLSWAYGFAGVNYIFASLLAFFILHEPIPALRWDGILIITAGTVIIGIS